MSRSIPLGLLAFAVLATAEFARAEPAHPLDALEASEIAAAVALLRADGHADEETLFASISLREPAKSAVLAWRPGEAFPRRAEVVLRKEARTQRALVDLREGRVESIRELEGVQPPITLPEILGAAEKVIRDPRMRAGLEQRGIRDFSQLFCAPRTVGNFGRPEEQTRRLAKVDCFDIRGVKTDVFATPIEGLFATVDLDSGEILEVTDLGVLPIPPGDHDLDVESVGPQRTVRPLVQSAPQGSNIDVQGSRVRWQKWSFHVRWDVRAGVILSLVSYHDGGAPRSVLYQGAMSEIFVPYQDPTPGWYYRNYMDQGDYGLGISGSELTSGADCPSYAVFLSPVMANAAGGAETLKNRICIFERAPGEPLWRHFDIVTEALESRPALELIVRFIATVGNYDYVFDWMLDQRGNITFRGGATGIDSVKGVRAHRLSDPTAAEDTAWGPLVAPGRGGINHDHFFSIRMDLDVDGTRNSFLRDRLVVESQPEGGPRRSLWRVRSEAAKKDSEARYRLSYERPALWRVINPRRTNTLGYPTSYAIRASGNALPLVDESDPPLARAAFATHHLWITPYHPDERFAGGEFPNQAPPGRGLPRWTERGRNVEDEDIVLWYTLGFHHIPSSEDWPVYNLAWHEVTLHPYNFFDRNPGLDVPPAQGVEEQP